jgi:hypothetical protein
VTTQRDLDQDRDAAINAVSRAAGAIIARGRRHVASVLASGDMRTTSSVADEVYRCMMNVAQGDAGPLGEVITAALSAMGRLLDWMAENEFPMPSPGTVEVRDVGTALFYIAMASATASNLAASGIDLEDAIEEMVNNRTKEER